MTESFFIGSGAEQIFASYHPPAGGAGRVLTIICPPFFSEYQRTHSTLRDLAIALAQTGQHVVRFDYRGSGDSFGELEETTVSDWLEDIALVEREGREISDCRAVQLLGVRAGALLACRSAGITAAVRRVVLWDPVVDGAEYVQSLRQAQEGLCDLHPYLGRAERREAMREYAGYTLCDRMVDELSALDGRVFSSLPAGMLHVISTVPELRFPVQGICCDNVAFQCDWDIVSNEPLTPRPVIERLLACLTHP
jgi:pimeloyl-ACP methyl ester carboxylesterase